jgi:CRP/FNR family cyclic AMP-dependent transcriptional regulator
MMARMSANPWFGALPLADRQALLASSEVLRLRPGEMLFRQGDAPGGFYGLLGGLLKISSLREDGRDATAQSPVEVLVVPQPAFAALMEGAPFARAIAGLLAARVRSLYGMVEDAALRSTRARVARRLLLLSRGDATLAPKARPVVPVSQEALAMMLGISRQTLSVELKAMVQEGAIALRYRCIEIVSAARLEALGNLSR